MIGLLEPPEETIWYEDPHEVAADYIVGINIVDVDGWRLTNDTTSMTARQRSAKRKQRSSEESYHSGSGSSSGESIFDMETEYSFAIMQLGRVLNISASDFDSPKAQGKEGSAMEWEYSGYILGVTTNGPNGQQPGTPGEVWLVYDFDTLDEDSNTAAHLCDLGPEDRGWGYLLGHREGEGDHERRGGFKIANGLNELGPKFQWNIQKSFKEVYDHVPTRLFNDKMRGWFNVNQPVRSMAGVELAALQEERENALCHQKSSLSGGSP
ncbi:hypothetical protein E8E11_006658 [Didymella keratinophila]|nr:hypothetical protein E8E11_006658 [Didymella keratinophila]